MNSLNGLKHEKGQNKNKNFRHSTTLTISYFSKFHYSFEKNYLFPNIPKNHQKIYKTPQNIDLCNECRDFVLLETRTRYFR